MQKLSKKQIVTRVKGLRVGPGAGQTLVFPHSIPVKKEIFWGVFFFEFVVKTTATGVLHGRSAYFKVSGFDRLVDDQREIHKNETAKPKERL